jgi:parvulin-like peptidyl-prolyl isomerase
LKQAVWMFRAYRQLWIGLLVGLTIGWVASCQQQHSGAAAEGDESVAAGEVATSAHPGPAGAAEAAASHILITYQGSRGATASITRSRSEADDLARRINVMIRSKRGSFEDMARKYSEDAATRDAGGYIGIFSRGEMVLPFETAVFSTEPGRIHGVIETEYGFHLIRRDPVRRYHMHHVLVAWREAKKSGADVTRSKSEAQALIEKVHTLCLSGRDDLCALTRKYSDDPNNRTSCGDLGWLEPGVLSAEIDEVIFRLRPGTISEVVESPYGYHVFWRE